MCRLFRENTPQAFKAAISRGFGFETDLRPCKDALIVFHDADLKRLGSDSHLVTDLTRRDIEQIVGFDVLTLEELLQLDRKGVELMVEIKAETPVEPVLETYRSLKPPNTIFGSLDPTINRALLEALDASVVIVGAETMEDLSPFLEGSYHLSVDEKLLTPDVVAQATGPIRAWTVDDPVRAKELVTLGVQELISNVPDQLLAEL